jgi:hypothetical protein
VSAKAWHDCRETARKEARGLILGNIDQFHELQAVPQFIQRGSHEVGSHPVAYRPALRPREFPFSFHPKRNARASFFVSGKCSGFQRRAEWNTFVLETTIQRLRSAVATESAGRIVRVGDVGCQVLATIRKKFSLNKDPTTAASLLHKWAFSSGG